jgi:diguanylate cyclase (GGDEF)-like protein
MTNDSERTQESTIEQTDHASGLGPRKGCLTVIQGRADDLGKHVVLGPCAVVGRDAECDFQLKDFGASRRHCEIAAAGDGVYSVRDLSSTNGTLVCGAPIRGKTPLRDGEKIQIAATVLRFTLADEIDLQFAGQVDHLLTTDPLTGLQSKRCFDDALEHALVMAGRLGKNVSLMMMDLDGIKAINDSNGHLFGAYAIEQAGKIIARVLGSSGEACRFGGDEFTAFLPGMDRSEALLVAEKIRHDLEHAGLVKDSRVLAPTISIGVACFPDDGTDMTGLTSVADEALYRAKAAGKNAVSGP